MRTWAVPPRALPPAALHYFATDQSLPVADFARAAAERGFDAVLLPEHTHIPVCTESPYPGGGDLPERYRRTLDPYVALSVIAARTDLKIGTCVSLVAQGTEAEFHGDHASLSPSWAWPKPAQRPSVPVLLGCQQRTAPLIRPMPGIVDDDTLRRSFARLQALGADQVVLDLQAVEGDSRTVLDRYAAAL